jgi:hypothetical protein
MGALEIAQLVSLIFPIVEKLAVDGTQFIIHLRDDKTVEQMCADLEKVKAGLPVMLLKT